MRLRERDELLARVERDLAAGAGVLLFGPRGSGRTSILTALSERSGQVVRRISGSDARPLGSQLGFDLDGIGAYTGLPAALIQQQAVVLIDDAGGLGRADGVLLAQLARAGVPLLVAGIDAADLPAPLLAEAQRNGWPRHRVEPISDDAVLDIAAELLGDDLSAESAATLLERAAGNPGIVTELLAGAARTLTHHPDGVDLGTPTITSRLIDFHTDALSGLVPIEREWLVRLAIAEQLPTELFPVAVLDHLVAADVASRTSGIVSVGNPLLADVIRDDLTVAEWRGICATLAGELALLGEDWFGLASLLRVRSGQLLTAEEAERAAGRAVARNRWVEASDLLAAIDPASLDPASPDPAREASLALLRGATLSGSGEHEAAARELSAAAAVAAGTDDRELLARIGVEVGLLHAVRRADPATAVVDVGAIAERLAGPERARLDADLVKWHLMAGLTPPAVPGADDAADRASRLGVRVIAAMVASLDGSPLDARAHVEEGLALLRPGEHDPGHARHLLGLSHYLSLAFDARLEEAEIWAVDHRDRAVRRADPSVGMWEYAAAELGLHAGRLKWSSALAGRARRHLAWQDFTGLRFPAIALQAALDARRGDLDSGMQTLRLLPDHATADVKVDLHLARVRAERHRLQGDLPAAAAELAKAGRRAIEESHRHLGVLAIDEAWMLHPDPEHAALLGRQRERSPLAMIFTARIQASQEQSTEALARIAEAFTTGGFYSRARHSWLQVALAHDRDGDPVAGARARRQASLLLASADCSAWPDDGDPAALTARELEVARLVASRVRSREIAVRLGLSVRTVDNHVARILDKLGLSRRSEVEHVFREVDRRH